jgi:hypothetical protein
VRGREIQHQNVTDPQHCYVAWQAGTSIRVVVPARQAGNRFLGSSKGYKFGLGKQKVSIYIIIHKNLVLMLLRTDLFCSVEKVKDPSILKKSRTGSATFVVVVETTNNPCLSLSGSISLLKPEGGGGGAAL